VYEHLAISRAPSSQVNNMTTSFLHGLTLNEKRQIATERYILSTMPVLYIPLWKRDGDIFISGDGIGHVCTVGAGGVPFAPPEGRILGGGANQFITIPDTPVLKITGPITISAWHKPNTTGYQMILAKDDEGANRSYNMHIKAVTHLARFITGGVAPIGIDSITAIGNVNKWWHQLGTYNLATQRIDLDGRRDNIQAAVGNITDTAMNIRIGASSVGTTQYGGLIGEICIWARWFSELESLDHCMATKWRYLG